MTNPLCQDKTYCLRPVTHLTPVVDANGRLKYYIALCDFHHVRPNALPPICGCQWCRKGLDSLCDQAERTAGQSRSW